MNRSCTITLNNLLDELNIKQDFDTIGHCPLHTRVQHTFTITPDETHALGYKLHCSNQDCNLDGTIFDLIKQVYQVSDNEIMSLFARNGKLYHCIAHNEDDINFINDELDKYKFNATWLASVNTWTRAVNKDVVEYLSKLGVNISMIRKFKFGLINKDNMCNNVRAVTKTNTNTELITIPYFNGKVITKIDFINIKTGEVIQNAIASDWYFNNGVESVDVVICNNYTAVMSIDNKINNLGMTVPKIVTKEFTGKANTVTFVSTISEQVPATTIIQAVARGKYKTIKIANVESDDTYGVTDAISGAISASSWLISHLNSCYQVNGASSIKELIIACNLTSDEKNNLIKEIKLGKDYNFKILKAIKDAESASATAVYGDVTYARSETGYFQTICGTKTRLTNFVIVTDYITNDKSGNKLLCGKIVTTEFSQPVVIPLNRLRGGEQAVRDYVWETLLEQGLDFKPYVVLPKNISIAWLVTLFTKATYKPGLNTLGARDMYINLPSLRVDCATGTTSSLVTYTGVPQEVLSLYGKLQHGHGNNYDTMIKVLRMKSHSTRVFGSILSHIVHQTLAASVLNAEYKPVHLVVPYAVGDTYMRNIIEQINYIFSGRRLLQEVPTQKQKQVSWFTAMSALGELPLICTTNDADDIKDRLRDVRGSMIVLIPELEAIKLNDVANTMFVVGQSDDLTNDMDMYLDDISNIIPGLLADTARKMAGYAKGHINQHPARTGSLWLSNLLSLKMYLYTPIHIDTNLTLSTVNTAHKALQLLRGLVDKNKFGISESSYAYRNVSARATKKQIGYKAGNTVVISKVIAMSALTSETDIFSLPLLEKQLLDLKLCTINKRGQWVIQMSDWDSYSLTPLKLIKSSIAS